MGAPKGNNFWELRSTHGRDKLFASPELLWEAACEYFEWCKENPLYEARPFSYMGETKVENVPKMRVFTMHGLCRYLGCNIDYFKNFKNQDRLNSEDFLAVINKIEAAVYQQKFEGAASDLFNPNLIMRDLGLTDKTELTTKDLQKEKIDYSKFTDAELQLLAELQSKGRVSET